MESSDDRTIEAYVVEMKAMELFDGEITPGVKASKKARAVVAIAKVIYAVDEPNGYKVMLLGRKWISDTTRFVNSEAPESMMRPVILNVAVDSTTDEPEAVAALVRWIHGYYDDPESLIPRIEF